MSMVQLSKCLKISQPTASQSATSGEKTGFYRDKDWVNKGADSFAFMPERFQDGRIVLAELTRIRNLSWEIPTEYRFSMLCHPDWLLPEKIRDAYQFFPHKSLWYAEDYPKFFNSKEPAIAVYGDPRTIKLGSQEWLAFNPTLTPHLGWKSINAGIFQWEDNEGFTTVESMWWKDGPINRLPYCDDDFSEGWIVLASEKVIEQIKSILRPIVRKKAVIRKIKKKEEGRSETVQCEFTQCPL